MEHNPEHSNMKDAVLAQIREQKVSMRPKLYFTLKAVAVLVVAGVILLVTVGIFNYISFSERVNGHESLLMFGPRGILLFLAIFPWPLLILDILLVVLLESLLRRFQFAYRRPVLYLILLFAVGAFALGVVLDRATHFNDDLLQRIDHKQLPPPLGFLYVDARRPAPHDRGIFRGTIVNVATSTFTLIHDDYDKDQDDGTYEILPPPETPLQNFSLGERLYVAGTVENGIVHAYGIEVLPAEMK